MKRELYSHKVNGLNESLKIGVTDESGPGGANHDYIICDHDVLCRVKFQKGGIQEAGINGISNEALLAIVEDRLACFQAGPFSCEENAYALQKVREAMMWLHKRTIDRVRRGVEGTSTN